MTLFAKKLKNSIAIRYINAIVITGMRDMLLSRFALKYLPCNVQNSETRIVGRKKKKKKKKYGGYR